MRFLSDEEFYENIDYLEDMDQNFDFRSYKMQSLNSKFDDIIFPSDIICQVSQVWNYYDKPLIRTITNIMKSILHIVISWVLNNCYVFITNRFIKCGTFITLLCFNKLQLCTESFSKHAELMEHIKTLHGADGSYTCVLADNCEPVTNFDDMAYHLVFKHYDLNKWVRYCDIFPPF